MRMMIGKSYRHSFVLFVNSNQKKNFLKNLFPRHLKTKGNLKKKLNQMLFIYEKDLNLEPLKIHDRLFTLYCQNPIGKRRDNFKHR